jgi:RNA ligase
MLDDGYIRQQHHPTEPLTIANYTEKASYGKVWNDVTLACRGLIWNTRNGQVVARPFRKFFNVSEHGDTDLADVADEPVEVWEKADGSLGVLYDTAAGLAVATRGSFTSEQAVHATGVLRSRYPNYRPPADVTTLVEILYPGNRVVVDYRDLDDLLLLAGIDIATGRTTPFDNLRAAWPGPAVTRYPHSTLAEALAAPELPNREGYVIRFTGSDLRMKSKFADYIRLHRLVTGVTARVVWEHAGSVDLHRAGVDTRRIAQTLQMSQTEVDGILAGSPGGDWMAPFLDAVPEEFATWVTTTAQTVAADVDGWEAEHKALFTTLGVDAANRRFAAARITMLPKPQQGAMFALLDGKTIRPMAWRATRPAHETPFVSESEEAN